MNQTSGLAKAPADAVVKDIRRATRRHYSAEDKIRIVLEGLRGEESIAELCRREGITSSMYSGWSKEFLEAGKKRLAGDTARAATSDEALGDRSPCPSRVWNRIPDEIRSEIITLALESRSCRRASWPCASRTSGGTSSQRLQCTACSRRTT
jgi:transposase